MCAKPIQEYWQQFQSNAISPNAPDVQRYEMRLAFYAGFSASLTASLEIARLDDTSAVAAVLALHGEAREFVNKL